MRTVAIEDLPAALGIDLGCLSQEPDADGAAGPPWDEEPLAAQPEDTATAPALAAGAGEWPVYPKRPVYPELPSYLAKQSMRKTKPAPATAKSKPKPKRKPVKKPAAPSMPDGLDPALFDGLPPMPDRLDDFDALRFDLDELDVE